MTKIATPVLKSVHKYEVEANRPTLVKVVIEVTCPQYNHKFSFPVNGIEAHIVLVMTQLGFTPKQIEDFWAMPINDPWECSQSALDFASIPM